MQLRNARNVGHWIRRNLFDGWQVLGTIGLAVGAFGFALLLLKAGHALPSTGSTFQLLETLGSEVPTIHATATPNVEATPSPPAVAPAPGAQVAPNPSATRAPVRRAVPPRQSTSASPTSSPTDTVTPTPTPAPRPSLPKPSPPPPTPTPAPRPSMH